MKIVRTTWERVTSEYVFEVDEEFCKDTLEWLNEHMVHEEDRLETLTPQDIKVICEEDYDEDSIWSKEVEMCFWGDHIFRQAIGEIIHDSVNDAVWDSDYQTVDSEMDDYEDSWED